MSIHLSPQSATALERKAFLHWVMLFIKLYRNPVACLSGQSISRSSIMISTTPACCYVVMFWGWSVFLKPFEELAVFKKRKRHIFRLISLTWWQRLRKTKHYNPKWTMVSVFSPPPLKNVFCFLLQRLGVWPSLCRVTYLQCFILEGWFHVEPPKEESSSVLTLKLNLNTKNTSLQDFVTSLTLQDKSCVRTYTSVIL